MSIPALFPKLQKLELGYGSEITPSALNALARLPLTELSLVNCAVTNEQLQNFNVRFPGLQSLDLSDNRILRGVDFNSLEGLPLKNLVLSGLQITDADIPSLVRNCPGLQSLDLKYTRITKESLPLLAGLTELQDLRLLDPAITPDALIALSEKLPNLRIHVSGYSSHVPFDYPRNPSAWKRLKTEKIYKTDLPMFRRGAAGMGPTVLSPLRFRRLDEK